MIGKLTMAEPNKCQTCVFRQPRKKLNEDIAYINWCLVHGMTVKPTDTCNQYKEAKHG